MVSGMGSGRWYCDECERPTGYGVSFATKEQAMAHVFVMHPETRVVMSPEMRDNLVNYITRFMCDVCGWGGQSFPTYAAVIIHLRMRHESLTSDVKDLSDWVMDDDWEGEALAQPDITVVPRGSLAADTQPAPADTARSSARPAGPTHGEDGA